MQRFPHPTRTARRNDLVLEPEFANTFLVEAEVVTNLVTHRFRYVRPEALGIAPEVAHQCVAKNQDLVWQTTAPEEGLPPRLEPTYMPYAWFSAPRSDTTTATCSSARWNSIGSSSSAELTSSSNSCSL